MSRCLRTLLLVVLAWTITSRLPAAELQQEFVDGLRKQDLGEMAVFYLRGLETAQKIPASMSETFHLELARSLQVAAGNTENVDEAEHLRVETRDQLEMFLKDHASHEQAAFAFDTHGVLSLLIGSESLKRAAGQKEFP